jgi:hypothetical protein
VVRALALAGALLAFVAASCDRGGQTTVPPAASESVRLAMRALRDKTGDLDAILRSQRDLDARDHARVVELLREIEALATGLEELPEGTHLPPLRLERLRSDAGRALETAADDPPNFYFAGAVSGACVYCHSRPL